MPRPPLISLRGATFRQTPTAPRTLFPNINFTLPSNPTKEKWTILGPSKSTFLDILRGGLLASPPNSRLYPALAGHGKWPQSAIQTVAFGAGSAEGMLKGAIGGDGYVSARYETLRDEFDVSLREWLGGTEGEEKDRIARELKLAEILDHAVMTLSNGQSRRARLAQALLRHPELLIVDEPFMGLDPPGKVLLSALLDRISTETIPVVLGLRPQDMVPTWSTHLAYAESGRLLASGLKENVAAVVKEKLGHALHLEGSSSSSTPHPAGIVEKAWSSTSTSPSPTTTSSGSREALVEMEKVRIAYYDNMILEDFSWTIRRGEKWGLFGPNGSGKTTLTSLITSDHPLTYSLPIKHFGKSRLPKVGTPGISVFDIQARIGISSPEIHSFFPRHLSLRRCVESGFAETFLTPPKLTPQERVHTDAILAEFADLVESWDNLFGGADMSAQRLALFLRATMPRRDLVVFDEAFSGMREEVRDRCFAFLKDPKGWEDERQAMVVISHSSDEVPEDVDRFVKLPEYGTGAKAVFGRL